MVVFFAPVSGAVGDGVGEGLAGVVPGQLGPAQHPREGGGAVLGGEPGALVGGERAGGGELVEPDGGAFGGGELGGVGEQLGRGPHAAGLAAAASVAIASADRAAIGSSSSSSPASTAIGSRCSWCRSRPWAGSSTVLTVATCAVLASRPRDSAT